MPENLFKWKHYESVNYNEFLIFEKITVLFSYELKELKLINFEKYCESLIRIGYNGFEL